ncbi:hypothetical protein B7R21_07885 [Subtercola boreus]|uniref:F420-dependent oxidoreductase n=2 Tax=Subtercola boreus TaxID=120213 RepID=A0A3E0VY42_9MICO|nr:hypothetical protein B7R21_07885 [Subtercola boreus]
MARMSARVVFGVIALVVAAALAIQLTLLFTGGQDANSGSTLGEIPVGTRLVRFFSYFTIQSNILVLITSTALFVSVGRDGAFWRVLRLDALLGIIITGLVYDIVLAPLQHLTGWAETATIGLHYISPWATLLAWFIFGPRPRISWRIFGFAFVWPILWLVYTFIHGAVSGWYPYPFLDVTTIGFPEALRNSAGVLVIAVVIAAVLTILDRRLPAAVH